MQFSAKNLKNNNTFGSCPPLGKILDPPLVRSEASKQLTVSKIGDGNFKGEPSSSG